MRRPSVIAMVLSLPAGAPVAFGQVRLLIPTLDTNSETEDESEAKP